MDKEVVTPLNLFGNSSVQRKLEYLDRLTAIARLNMIDELRYALLDRMADVCISIEKDMGLSGDVETIDISTNSEFKKTKIPMARGAIIPDVPVGTMIPFNPDIQEKLIVLVKDAIAKALGKG